ncbi:MAG: DNA primase [bacterium]
MLNAAQQIKEKLDIVEVIQDYVQLTKSGVNFKACCPFHNEKTPSFVVSQEKQIWHCFGCGLGGDVFNFIMQIEGTEFKDALRILAERAGVKLEKQQMQAYSEKNSLEKILKQSALYFQNQLINSSEGKAALNYLLNERGIKKELVEKFSIGYAPNQWSVLSQFLSAQGEKKDNIVKTGMSFQKDSNPSVLIDRFRGRIMFPIFSQQGQIVGFSGRIFPPAYNGQDISSVGKYINSPQTALFNKSLLLYGLDKAKTAIRKENCAIIVEGQMDVIASFQAGVENAVASSGTALTVEQLQILRHLCDKIVIAFDTDEAGIKAAQKGIDLALNLGFNISIVKNLGKKDAADLVKENPQLWKEAVSGNQSIIDFYFAIAFKNFNSQSVEDKKRAAKQVLPAIAKISNHIERAHYIHKLAEKLSLSEKVLENALSEISNQSAGQIVKSKTSQKPNSDPSCSAKKTKQDFLEEDVLSRVINRKFSDINYLAENDFSPDIFKNSVHNKIARVIWGIIQKGGQIEKEILQEAFDGDEKLKSALNYLLILEESVDGENPAEDFKKSFNQLKASSIRQILKSISGDIKQAELRKDKETLNILIEEFERFSKKLISLEKQNLNG